MRPYGHTMPTLCVGSKAEVLTLTTGVNGRQESWCGCRSCSCVRRFVGRSNQTRGSSIVVQSLLDCTLKLYSSSTSVLQYGVLQYLYAGVLQYKYYFCTYYVPGT